MLFKGTKEGKVVVNGLPDSALSALASHRIQQGKFRAQFRPDTQQFNTSTSLGRLTLNILLSFAQFERELIGERTRDKMSAARRKGKWVGGSPVLGYDVAPGGGQLIVNQQEAERVRAIFALFEQHRCAILTLAEIERRGWTLKSWTRKSGQLRSGGPFAKNSLRRMLTNILYTGAISHKGQHYPGEHSAILETGTWERVQALLRHRAAFGVAKARNKHHALLSGLLFCESCGTRMVYSYSGKSERKYPYYVCLNAQRKGLVVNAPRPQPVRRRPFRGWNGTRLAYANHMSMHTTCSVRTSAIQIAEEVLRFDCG